MPKKTPVDTAIIDKLILLMVSGMAEADLPAAAVGLGVSADKAQAAVSAARRKLNLAATVNQDEELAKSITRLNDIYARALKAQDQRTALTAQKELNKLLALYTVNAPEAFADAGEAQKELETIGGHIAGLKLADDTYPLVEHVRLAAQIVRESPQWTLKVLGPAHAREEMKGIERQIEEAERAEKMRADRAAAKDRAC